MEIFNIAIDVISINGGTQSRAELNEAVVAEYAEIIRFGGELPPAVVFEDGSNIWLADGFHRFHAHRAAGAMEINCDVRSGTKRDAILFSVGANAVHGLRRTNEDKRRAVMTLLNDAEWSVWSDSAIAKACGVSDKTVSSYRASSEIPKIDSTPVVRTVERNGKTYEQNTANIGKAKATPSLKNVSVITQEENLPISTSSELDELRERLEELQTSLKETLADNEMMGRVFDADDKIAAAIAEAKRQKAIADNAERTLIAKNAEFIERARAVNYWKSRAEKAEKLLGRAA